MKKYDIAAIGEMLIDFIPCKRSDSGKTVLEPKEGGAPCNVLAMAAKLSKKTAFIGKVGADAFGEMLIDTASRAGIYTGGVVKDENVFTTLAFVSLNEEGDRSLRASPESRERTPALIKTSFPMTLSKTRRYLTSARSR